MADEVRIGKKRTHALQCSAQSAQVQRRRPHADMHVPPSPAVIRPIDRCSSAGQAWRGSRIGVHLHFAQIALKPRCVIDEARHVAVELAIDHHHARRLGDSLVQRALRKGQRLEVFLTEVLVLVAVLALVTDPCTNGPKSRSQQMAEWLTGWLSRCGPQV